MWQRNHGRMIEDMQAGNRVTHFKLRSNHVRMACTEKTMGSPVLL